MLRFIIVSNRKLVNTTLLAFLLIFSTISLYSQVIELVGITNCSTTHADPWGGR